MDHYAKLFDLAWVQVWMVEAVVAIAAALVLGAIFCKLARCINNEED